MRARGRHQARWYWTLLLPAVVVSGCSSAFTALNDCCHEGEVVAVSGDSVSVRVGEHDGVAVGQELAVYRLKRKNAGAKRRLLFDEVQTGVLRIEEVVGDHLSRATLVSGEVRKGNVVGLRPADG